MMIANRYDVIQSLGSGGFGDTFLAKDTQMPSGKQVVIKRLKPAHQNNISIELIQGLFEKEAKVLEELGQHCQQIPTLYAYFVENEEFYLVQEYIEGKSLAELGTIHHSQCESILSSLLNTLKYVHGKNIIHRDIKPENIIIRESDKLPVLIDFGAVKESMGAVSLSSGSTVSSVIVGTRGFIPPEQSLGRAVLSSDLYALSLTMIYSLTGKYPIEIPSNNITGELDWQSYIPNLPNNLKMVLEKATKMDISSRYPTAEAMYQALHNSSFETMRVVPPPVNTIDLSKSVNPTSNATVIIPNPLPTNNVTSGNYGVNGVNQNPNPQNNNLLVILITALLVALGVSGGFLVIQNMNQTQNKLAQIEREKEEIQKQKEEMEAQLIEEDNQKEEIESLKNEVKNTLLEAERLKQQAQRNNNTGISNNNNNNSVETHDISQQEALNIVQRWYDAKPFIFGTEFNQSFVSELTTGTLYYETTKSDGSMDWLMKNGCYYDYEYSNIDNVISFNNSGTRPSLTVRVSEKLALHGTSSAGCNSRYKSYTKPVTYWFEKENGNWKIYNYNVE